MRIRMILISVAATAVLAGCASSPTTPGQTTRPSTDATDTGGAETNPVGDIPDTQVFIDYAPPGGGYTVQVPEGWSRSESSDGSISFTDKYNSVRIGQTSSATAPTVASGQQELAALSAADAAVTPGAATIVSRLAGPVLQLTYQADSTPNPVTGKTVRQDVERYEFWTGGRRLTVTLSAPVGADNVDPWRTITDSFRWTP